MNDLITYPFIDRALAQRLERAEAQSNANFVETRARLQPESQADWIEVAGAYAMFDGVASPLTQTFGVGIFAEFTAIEFEQLEAFFASHQAPVYHEISPLAGANLLPLLHERGYAPIELTSVMFRPIDADFTVTAPRNERIQTRLINPDEAELWAQTSALGWSEFAEYRAMILDLARLSAANQATDCFIAELKGQAIATGGLITCDGVGVLAGASTIPAGRQQGAQLALLETRLRYAAAQGCDLAMMCAAPGSASQRNAERQGFRIAYTRIKWGRQAEQN